LKFLGKFQKLDDFLQLCFGFIDSRHIGEGNSHLLFGEDLNPRLTDRKHPLRAGAHPPNEKAPEEDEEGQRQQPGEQERHPFILSVAGVFDSLLIQELHQLRVFHPKGEKVLGLPPVIPGFTPNTVGPEHQVRHLASAHPLFELRIGNLLTLRLGQIPLEPGDQEHGNNEVPERKMDLLLGGIGGAGTAIARRPPQPLQKPLDGVEVILGLLCHPFLLRLSHQRLPLLWDRSLPTAEQ